MAQLANQWRYTGFYVVFLLTNEWREFSRFSKSVALFLVETENFVLDGYNSVIGVLSMSLSFCLASNRALRLISISELLRGPYPFIPSRVKSLVATLDH